MAGFFVEFCGIDGSGKTTALRNVAEKLNALLEHREILVTREPGGTPTAERIREILLHRNSGNQPEDPLTPISEALLFYAARVNHTQFVITPALEREAVVLSDRYYHASLAYQSIICEETQDIHNVCRLHLAKPDLLVYLKIDPEIAARRMVHRGVLDNIESRDREYFENVAAKFQTFVDDNPKAIVVDATQSQEAITLQILDEILERIK